jgi:site-specific recombinase XerD
MSERTHFNRGRKLPAEPLTEHEASRLIRACSRRAPSGVRNAALVAVLWRTGLRCSEALDLAPRDINLEAGTLRVREGKGRKARLVGIDPMAGAIVERWLKRRAELGIGRSAPLFCQITEGKLGEEIQSSYVRHLLKRLGKRAGIEKRTHPHGLRHSFASGLADEGIDPHRIQQLLGHSNLATTSRYVSTLNPMAALDVVRAREWSL